MTTAAPLTAVSLFAGIGGFDLAMARNGAEVVAAVEIDDAAQGVLADHFPHTTQFTDIREVTGDQLRAAGFVPERGILTAGFPCQDLSLAGRRGGMAEGTRSGLYWEIDRLLAELRPAWVILENVPGLLSAVCPDPHSPVVNPEDLPVRNEEDATDRDVGWLDDGHLLLADQSAVVAGRGACEGGCFPAHGGAMGLVLGSLADRGYGFAYRVLDAQHFGVPQRRRRVIIVGHLGGDPRGPVQVLLEPESSGRGAAQGGTPGQDVAGTLGGGSGTRGWCDDHERMTFLPVTTAFDEAQITSPDNRANPKPGDPAPPLSASGRPSVARTLTSGVSSDGVSAPGRRSEDDANLVAYALRRDPGGTWQGPNTNYVVETLRSHPRPGSNSNGVIVTHALTSEGADASEDGTDQDTPMAFNPQTGGSKARIGYSDTPTALCAEQVTAVQVATAVRRLTPLECERLQGFPDGWTTTSNGRAQADAPRYRQLGNAIAVPVAEWVSARIVAEHAREEAA